MDKCIEAKGVKPLPLVTQLVIGVWGCSPRPQPFIHSLRGPLRLHPPAWTGQGLGSPKSALHWLDLVLGVGAQLGRDGACRQFGGKWGSRANDLDFWITSKVNKHPKPGPNPRDPAGEEP